MLILNEEQYAKNLYDGMNKDVKSTMAKIRYVTRYLAHSEAQSDDEIYTHTVEWMKKYHNNFDESCYSNLISDAIKKARQYPFYIIESIKITQSELDTISSLNNLRAEKVLFVLLCMAKQQKLSNGFTNGLVKYSITELCKLARISVPADDREYILYEIVKRGLLGYPKKNDTQCLIVNFMSIDNAVLELDEIDCQELAYVYLNWKNNCKGYTRCQICNRLIRQGKTKPKKYCEKCGKEVEREQTKERVKRYREKCNGNLTQQND
jgi:predicted small metal-binding protein